MVNPKAYFGLIISILLFSGDFHRKSIPSAFSQSSVILSQASPNNLTEKSNQLENTYKVFQEQINRLIRGLEKKAQGQDPNVNFQETYESLVEFKQAIADLSNHPLITTQPSQANLVTKIEDNLLDFEKVIVPLKEVNNINKNSVYKIKGNLEKEIIKGEVNFRDNLTYDSTELAEFLKPKSKDLEQNFKLLSQSLGSYQKPSFFSSFLKLNIWFFLFIITLSLLIYLLMTKKWVLLTTKKTTKNVEKNLSEMASLPQKSNSNHVKDSTTDNFEIDSLTSQENSSLDQPSQTPHHLSEPASVSHQEVSEKVDQSTQKAPVAKSEQEAQKNDGSKIKSQKLSDASSSNLGASQFCTLAFLRGDEIFGLLLYWLMFLHKPDTSSDFTLPYQQILDNYHNEINNNYFQYLTVSETKESIFQRNRGSSTIPILKQESSGNYWLIEQSRVYYLVPQKNFIPNKYSYETLQTLFYCFGYSPDFSKRFILLKPAIIHPIEGIDRWKLKEKGVIQFESAKIP